MSAKPDSGSAERRLLRLAGWFIARGEPATREEIYEAFSRDYRGTPAAMEKKWTRDKDALHRLGVPVHFVEMLHEHGGAYTIEVGSYLLPKLDFAPEEAAILWMAGRAALRSADHPLREDLEAALRKLVVGARGFTPRVASLEADRTPLPGDQLRQWLEVIDEAVERRKRVKLRYRRLSGELTERHVDPYGYACRRGEWLFVGHCHLREARRVFYLDRVQALELDPADKKRADYQIPDDFDIRSWSRQEPWDYLVHEPCEALVRFRGTLARVAQRLLPGAQVTAESDGARVARLPVRNLRGLVRQALAWGPEAELLEPAEGRQMAREMLAPLAEPVAERGLP